MEVSFLQKQQTSIEQTVVVDVKLRFVGPTLFENGRLFTAREVEDRPLDLLTTLGRASGDTVVPDRLGTNPRRGMPLFFLETPPLPFPKQDITLSKRMEKSW